jgi:hypothetical protein
MLKRRSQPQTEYSHLSCGSVFKLVYSTTSGESFSRFKGGGRPIEVAKSTCVCVWFRSTTERESDGRVTAVLSGTAVNILIHYSSLGSWPTNVGAVKGLHSPASGVYVSPPPYGSGQALPNGWEVYVSSTQGTQSLSREKRERYVEDTKYQR